MIYTRQPSLQLGAGLVKDFRNERTASASLPSTLNSPVHKESPWVVSDIVEPAIMTVLQDPHEEECPQPAGRTWLTCTLHINQGIIH